MPQPSRQWRIEGTLIVYRANIILFGLDHAVIVGTRFATMHTRLRNALKGGHNSGHDLLQNSRETIPFGPNEPSGQAKRVA